VREADWTAFSAVGKRMADLSSTPFFKSGSSRLLFATACRQCELTHDDVKKDMSVDVPVRLWRQAASVQVDGQPSRVARRGNFRVGCRKVPQALLQQVLYENSAPRSKILRRGGKDVVQRALQSRKASVFRSGADPLIGMASKSTLYAQSKRDVREVVTTNAKVDVCSTCHSWDRVVEPKLLRLMAAWRDHIEMARAGQSKHFFRDQVLPGAVSP
jgi:hypothetical protein